ncbi:GAF domain-containing protein [Vibrio vulnificus]|uniref:GAF domain-containing protein n=1 Tax=Vibrio vulnificus TaxID=672 RepID=UPI000A91EF75|nr:GAF domain-containing protein [Vibrio vulnificus]
MDFAQHIAKGKLDSSLTIDRKDELVPTHFLAIPLCVDKQLIGTVLLGAFHEFSPIQRRFINEVVGNLAIVFNATKARLVIKSLLEETQQQKAHLSKANEDLEAQTQALRVSEEELQAQQEELRVTNEELEEQTKVLRASEEQRSRLNQPKPLTRRAQTFFP